MEERAVPAVGRRARTPATFMVVDMSRLCACVSVDGHERLWRCLSRCETWHAFSASRCSSARAWVILESIRPYGRTCITDGRNGRVGQTFEHGAAPRGPQHATRAHVQVASSRRDANPPRERSAEPTSPGREAAREASETRDAAPVNHLSPWIKASAPSSATSSPARARSAWRTTTKRCSRSSGSNTEGEARTDTTTRGTSSSPPRTPPRSSRKGNASARTPRRRNTRIEGAGSSSARYARSLTPESPTRARRPRRPRASVRPPSSDATPTPRATNRGKPHPIFGYRRSFRLIPRPTRPSPSRNPASTPVPTLHRPAGVLRA